MELMLGDLKAYHFPGQEPMTLSEAQSFQEDFYKAVYAKWGPEMGSEWKAFRGTMEIKGYLYNVSFWGRKGEGKETP